MSGTRAKSVSALDTAEEEYLGTTRLPGHIPPYDADTFRRAGLTVWDDLKTQFGEDYDSLVADAKRLKDELDHSKWQPIVQKAEIGGRYKLAKEIVRHGGKGKVAEQDFDLHRDTATDYLHLYSALPWAYEDLMAEAAKSRDNGKDHTFPSIAEIIRLGNANMLKLGVTKTKPKYTGDGKVLAVNPKDRTVELTDLPAGFPGRKSQIPYWEEVTVANMEKGLRVWQEVTEKDEAKRKTLGTFYTVTLPTTDSEPKVVDYRQRLIMARITKKYEVLPIDEAAKAEMLTLIDFDAPEPKPYSVFDIDPLTGVVGRLAVMSDAFVDDKGAVFTPLNRPFTNLTLVQQEPNADPVFTLAGMDDKYSGRSYIVRLDRDSHWLVPLQFPLSIEQVREHVAFVSRDAMLRAAGKEDKPDPTIGFEVMDNERLHDYFGVADRGEWYTLLARAWNLTGTTLSASTAT